LPIAVLELEVAEVDLLDGFGVSVAEANECGSLLATVANSRTLALLCCGVLGHHSLQYAREILLV